MSLNKVMLIGYVGKDPVVRYTDKNVCTASFSLATSTPGKVLPNGTTIPERTEWHNILLWSRLGEIAERYVHKGDKLYVEGEMHNRTYTDKRGNTRNITEIWGKEIELLSPPPSKTSNAAAVSSSAPSSNLNAENGENSSASDLPF